MLPELLFDTYRSQFKHFPYLYILLFDLQLPLGERIQFNPFSKVKGIFINVNIIQLKLTTHGFKYTYQKQSIKTSVINRTILYFQRWTKIVKQYLCFSETRDASLQVPIHGMKSVCFLLGRSSRIGPMSLVM